MAVRYDFEIMRGDTNIIPLSFTNAEGEYIDITDWTIYFTMKDSEAKLDSQAALFKDVISHISALYGQSQIELLPQETFNLLGSYLYDIQVKTNEEKVYTILFGTITVNPDITRRV